MADDIILTDLKDGVLTITLNRPKANAFTTNMAQALTKVFREAGRNDAVRVVLLTGAGKIFSAGQDVTEFGQGEHVSFRKHLLRTYNPLIVEMRRLEKSYRDLSPSLGHDRYNQRWNSCMLMPAFPDLSACIFFDYRRHTSD